MSEKVFLEEIDGHVVAKAVASGMAEFMRSLRANVYGLWSGRIDLFNFTDSMYVTVERNLRNAWFEGARAMGIAPDELTVEELNMMNGAVAADFSYIPGFGRDIEASSKANGGKLSSVMPRTKLWANRYNETRNLAMQMAGKNRKLLWVRNAKESCSSCLRMEGRVYRASTWQKYDLRPQAPHLACMSHARGVAVCLCEFVVTDEPVTPGRPPAP